MSQPVRDPLLSPVDRPRAGATGVTAEFEEIYRSHVGVVTAYFARRTGDPQATADLTADTFVAAIVSFDTFDPARGTARAWLFGIARRVFAQYCEAVTKGRDTVVRLGSRRGLDRDEIAELDARIDAERAGRVLVETLAALPQVEREAIELVDLAGLTPKETAKALGVSPGALRIRLFRARGRLRKLAGNRSRGAVWVALAFAGAVTAGIAAFGGGPDAYAVTRNADGSVTVTVREVEGVDAANAKLRELGVRAKAVPMIPGCPSLDGADTYRGDYDGLTYNGDDTVTIGPGDVPAGYTILLGVRPDANGYGLGFTAPVRDPAPSCLLDPRFDENR